MFCSIVGRRGTCWDAVGGSTRIVDASCDECGRSPITGDVGRDGRLSTSLSDEMLLDEMIVNWLVLWVLIRLM